MIKRMNNTDPAFYGYMGKIFGSRKVQKETSDRFYDDDGKEWILHIDKKSVTAVVSVKDNIIKNVYAEDAFALMEILREIYREICKGLVPISYKEMYAGAGYKIVEEKKNFLEIKGGKEVGENR